MSARRPGLARVALGATAQARSPRTFARLCQRRDIRGRIAAVRRQKYHLRFSCVTNAVSSTTSRCTTGDRQPDRPAAVRRGRGVTILGHDTGKPLPRTRSTHRTRATATPGYAYGYPPYRYYPYPLRRIRRSGSAPRSAVSASAAGSSARRALTATAGCAPGCARYHPSQCSVYPTRSCGWRSCRAGSPSRMIEPRRLLLLLLAAALGLASWTASRTAADPRSLRTGAAGPADVADRSPRTRGKRLDGPRSVRHGADRPRRRHALRIGAPINPADHATGDCRIHVANVPGPRWLSC